MKKSPKFWNRLLENSENWGKKITKLTLAALLAFVFNQQTANAKNTNNELAAALRWEWYKTVKVYKYWKDGKAWKLIVKEKKSSKYEPNVKVYWLWQKFNKVYNWVGIRFDSDNFEWVAEWSSNYKKFGWVIKLNLPEKYYLKFGFSWLKLKNYLDSWKDIEQTAYGIAVWKKVENFYGEIGRINYHLNQNLWDAYANYVELVKRIKTNIWQFDFLVNGVNAKYDDTTKNRVTGTGQYYLTENTQVWVTYSSHDEYPEHDYKISIWIKWPIWSDHVLPYFEWTYNLPGGHTQIEITDAEKKLSWKDQFEKLTENINYPFPERIVGQKELKKKLIETMNQPPKISISASATSITEWESVTLNANATDSDGTVKEIDWYDQNGNKIGSGKSITITPSSTGTFSYYAEAIDNKGAVSKSKSISINVEAVPTPTFTFTPGENVSKIEDTGSTLEIYRNGATEFKVNVQATNLGYVGLYDWKKYYDWDVMDFTDSNWPDGKSLSEYDKEWKLLQTKTINLH